ncbi:MAG: TSUP family transporter [Pseudomonadota bacterium]
MIEIDGVSELALAAVLVCAFVAGLVDAMVGGGGLVQLPALFAALPTAPPASALGTSKLAGMLGTASAAWRYSRSVEIPWHLVGPAAAIAFATSLAGAVTVTHVPPDLFRPGVPVLLTLVLAYTLWKKDLGGTHAPRALDGRARLGAGALVAAIGFADGFFGPGTGSCLRRGFVRLYGFDFLRAAAGARVVNVATNVAALAWFGGHGHVLWILGFAMAAANVAGSLLGARRALRHGAGLVRIVFVVVVGALILKTGWDALRLATAD